MIDRAIDWAFATSKPFRIAAFSVLGIGLFLAVVLVVLAGLAFVVGLAGAASDGARWGSAFVIGLAPIAAATLSLVSFILFWAILVIGRALEAVLKIARGVSES